MGCLKLSYYKKTSPLKVVYGGKYVAVNNAQRLLSVDPLANQFAQWSPYSSFANNPVTLIDEDGLYPIFPWGGKFKFNVGKAEIVSVDYKYIEYQNSQNNFWIRANEWLGISDDKPHVYYKDNQLHRKAEHINPSELDRGGSTINPYGGISDRKDDSNPKNNYRNSQYKLGSESIVGDFWNGWTAGWNAAAASGTYSFIDDVTSTTAFNKYYVENNAITRVETYQFNGESDQFEWSATTSFIRTDIVTGKGRNQKREWLLQTTSKNKEGEFEISLTSIFVKETTKFGKTPKTPTKAK